MTVAAGAIFRPAALDALETAAREAASAEAEFREGFAREIARLESESQRAWRRLNFLIALVAADIGAPDREASRAAQREAAIEELDWSEADAAALDAMEALADTVYDERVLAESEALADEGAAPVSEAAHQSTPAQARAAALLMALSDFEARFEEVPDRRFAALFDRRFPETPLVDV